MTPPIVPFFFLYLDFRKLNIITISAYIGFIYKKCRRSDLVPNAKHGVGNWSGADVQAIFLPTKFNEAFITLHI